MKLHTKYQSPWPSNFTLEDFFFFFFHIQVYGRSIFDPGSFYLNNFGRRPLHKVIYQISKAWAFQFQMKIFKVFSLYEYLKQVSHRAGPFLTTGP